MVKCCPGGFDFGYLVALFLLLKNSKVNSLSHVRLFATPWTVAYKAPLSMGFSRQEYRSGLPFPSPENLPDPGIELGSPALQADSLLTEPFDTCLQYSVVNERRLWTEGSGYRKLY